MAMDRTVILSVSHVRFAVDERTALFQTIMESPDDPVARLVFADWIEEHGDAERAEFIRMTSFGYFVLRSVNS